MQAMSVFGRLGAEFGANWTTVLVGWVGLGHLSPWPDRWASFPSLLSREQIVAFAREQLALTSDPRQMVLIVRLTDAIDESATREEIRNVLESIAKYHACDAAFELRKWRVAMLEALLDGLAHDAVDGLLALSEFWQDFGFPSDSPHEVQGRGNTIAPAEYYQQENYLRTVQRHREWLARERSAILRPRQP